MINLNTKKIIITTDFSDTSLLAINHGALIAKQTNGEIYLVHIIHKHWETFNVFTPTVTVESIESASSAVQIKLEELAENVRTEFGVTVTTVINTGNPTSEIVKFAKEIGAGLIVMGTHGYTAWEDLTIGSTALKVITKGSCPVLTMSQLSGKSGFKKIILPIDTSSHTRQKVVLALELAKQFSSHVSILGLLATNEEEERGDLNVIIKQVEDAAKDKGIAHDVSFIDKIKNRAVATVQFCDKVGGDLICIMTDQDAEVSGFFLGPYALQIIHHSKVPVLSIKPENHPENDSWTMLSGTGGYNY